MRKFLAILVLIFVIISPSFAIVAKNDLTSANAIATNISNEVKNYQSQILQEFVEYKKREPGSDGEKLAAHFILNKLNLIANSSNLQANNDASTENGLQKFSFVSIFDDEKKSSQNVIFSLKSTSQSQKKVIISCNYDAVVYENYVKADEGESVAQSAGDVALLLSLAKFLSSQTFDFDIEFVFFGAGSSNNAGSKYFIAGIDDKEKDNILCNINLDGTVLGKNLYFYCNELETNFENYVEAVLKTNESDLGIINTVHLGKIAISNVDSLAYSHRALQSDNATFVYNQINSINIFAGEFDDGIVYGDCEFDGEDLVKYTLNDNLASINTKYGQTAISDNMASVFDAICGLISDSDFVSQTTKSKNELGWFYYVFANEKFAVYLTAIALILVIIFVLIIQYKLTLKSYDANVEVEFLNSVVELTKNIDKENKGEEVAKVVSQVVVKDIKKDKTVKQKKKK